MKSIREMTQPELGAFVQSHLREMGIDVVLSGGAAVSIYSHAKYVSLDLDMVNLYAAKASKIRESMREIGFEEEGRHYKHPLSEFLVEFPPGPLTIGEEEIEVVEERVYSTGILRIISATDCVKDRLAAFYHWGDRQCLSQAIMVAESNDVDMEGIATWSASEGRRKEFLEFQSGLQRDS